LTTVGPASFSPYRPASPDRRQTLRLLAAGGLAAGLGLPHRAFAQNAAQPAPAEAATATATEGAPQPFSFDLLSEEMQRLSRGDPEQPAKVEGFLAGLDYDGYNHIRFRDEAARWQEDGSRFRLGAFHLGWLYDQPVRLFDVSDGTQKPMTFTTADFEYRGALEGRVPPDAPMPGVAGFRVNAPLNRPDRFDELIAFLGASYFRALGRDNFYGLSARGLAVNTGLSGTEEFPRFSAFYVERPAPDARHVRLYAALQSQSVTGAYAFTITPGAETIVDVTARLFFRADIEQLGLAPLTSMYLLGENDPGSFDDYRPRVHDSDTLVMVNRGGDHFVRPLNNPPRLASSYFAAENPVGFGLIQRNRNFDDYLDAEAHYERRPSLMVEPLGDWGRGSVRLVEIPSDLEGNDNIVAFWVPEAPAREGEAMEVSWRLRWGADPGRGDAELARVLRTRTGIGGISGVRESDGTRKFVIDFAGGPLSELPDDADVSPTVSASRGEIRNAILSKVSGTRTWRLVIDIAAPGERLVELRAGITGYGRNLSEIWLYQWMQE